MSVVNKNVYICRYGLYHDKPCVQSIDGLYDSRSNNGWIYTAYAKQLGFDLDKRLIVNTYLKCIDEISLTRFSVNRLPDKEYPPMSRDEVIGMVSLGRLNPSVLKRYNWIFYGYGPEKYRLIDQVKAVLSLRGKHRNYVWENNIYAAYPIVFKLMLHDRYYAKKINKIDVSFMEFLMFHLYILTTVFQNNISSKNILWLQLKDMNSKFLIKLIDKDINFNNYFGSEHIFNNANKGMNNAK